MRAVGGCAAGRREERAGEPLFAHNNLIVHDCLILFDIFLGLTRYLARGVAFARFAPRATMRPAQLQPSLYTFPVPYRE